jgi:hypothetical protein
LSLQALRPVLGPLSTPVFIRALSSMLESEPTRLMPHCFICRLQPCIAECLHFMFSQTWALTECVCVCEENSSSCLHFLYSALSERPLTCRCRHLTILFLACTLPCPRAGDQSFSGRPFHCLVPRCGGSVFRGLLGHSLLDHERTITW